MGERGPAPKRSDQKAGHPTTANPRQPDKVRARGTVAVPSARSTWDPRVVEWYDSLRDSAQMQLFEPSDWHFALWAGDLMQEWYTNPTAGNAAAMTKAFNDLGVTEVQRRRAAIEVEREQEDDQGAETAMADIRKLRAVSEGE